MWGTLTCNSKSQAATSTVVTNTFFESFPIDSWQGIISIVAIIAVFVLCVLMILYVCVRYRRKQEAATSAIAMTALPPYTAQGDFVFPDANPPHDPNAGDPFAADKAPTNQSDHASQASLEAAAEKVRKEQAAAYEEAQRASRDVDDGKHQAGSPGYGGVSRLTVT
jgi:hypothetical protein